MEMNETEGGQEKKMKQDIYNEEVGGRGAKRVNGRRRKKERREKRKVKGIIKKNYCPWRWIKDTVEGRKVRETAENDNTKATNEGEKEKNDLQRDERRNWE